MSLGVAVADGLELEVSVKPDEPAGQTVEQLREWRVDVEVVLALDVMRRELAKVDFVKAGVRSSQYAGRGRRENQMVEDEVTRTLLGRDG